MTYTSNDARKAKLRYYFGKYNMTLRDVAKELGVSYPTLHRKVTDIDEFSIGEAKRLIKIFEITKEDASEIFLS